MVVIPIDNLFLKAALNEFSQCLSSLVGPHGNMCLCCSSVDSLVLTSSSNQIISNISFKNPVFQFAVQCIKSQNERCGDGGLYCGIFLSKLLARLLDNPVPQKIMCDILNELRYMSQFVLQVSDQLRMPLTLDSVQPLMAVARSVLFSKTSILEGKDRNAMAHANIQVSLLVRAFLYTETSIENILLSIHEGSDQQCLFNGVLYPCLDEEYSVIFKNPWYSVSLLLFSVMLSDQIDCKEKDLPGAKYVERGKAQFEAAQCFMEKAISCGIQVIACQKVVHPLLLVKLRRKGILVLQRLGKRMAQAVEKVSGAIPISNLNESSLELFPSLKGHLEKVEHVRRSNKRFLVLEGEQSPGLCTVLLTSSSKGSCEELRIVAYQVLTALSQVLLDRAVCPGAGCTEVYLCCHLSRQVLQKRKELCERLKCGPSMLEIVLKWFQEGLLSAAGLDFKCGKLLSDSIYHHAWKGSQDGNIIPDFATCNCGLVTSHNVLKLKGKWSVVTLHQSEPIDNEMATVSITPQLAQTSYSNCTFDVHSTKRNAIGLALDSCVAISNIGAIVTCTE